MPRHRQHHHEINPPPFRDGRVVDRVDVGAKVDKVADILRGSLAAEMKGCEPPARK